MFTIILSVVLVASFGVMAPGNYQQRLAEKKSTEQLRVRDEIECLHYQICESFTRQDMRLISRQIDNLIKSIKYKETHQSCMPSFIMLNQLFRNHLSFIENKKACLTNA